MVENREESVIEIESDEDMSEPTDKQFTKWYTNILKALDRRYSNTFDTVVKEIITSNDKSMSELKKKSLKTVLSFLFTIVCSGENINLFEQLYHYNAQHRIEAIKYLVNNLEKMSFSDDSKSLLKDSLIERLSDDSPLVVTEVLKFETHTLNKHIGKEQLQLKLLKILEKTLERPDTWETTGLIAIKHLASTKMTKSISIEMFVGILPLLLQPSALSINFLRRILNSSLAKQVEFIEACQNATANINDDKDAIFDGILQQFESKKGLPSTDQILEYIKTFKDSSDVTLYKAFYSMLLLAYSIDNSQPLNPETALEILDIMTQFQSVFKMVFVENNSKWTINVAMGVYPVNINVMCVKNVIEAVNWKGLFAKSIEFNKMTTSLYLLHKVFEYLVTSMSCYQSKKQKYSVFADGLQYLFDKVFPKYEKRVEFLSNYFTIDVLKHNIKIQSKTQVYILQHFNSTLENDGKYAEAAIELEPFIRILNGLRSTDAAVRDVSYETLIALSKLPKFKYSTLIGKLIKRQTEISMDENQLPLILFTIFKKKSSKDLIANLSEFIDFIKTTKDNYLLVALLLEALTHVNTDDIVKSIAKTALNILTSTSQEMNSSSKKMFVLDTYKSSIVQNILSRLTPQTIQIVKKESSAWQLLFKSAECFGIFLRISESKETSVSSVLVKILNDDLFGELNTQHQQQLVAALVNSATYSENIHLHRNVSEFFKRTQISGKICLDILNGMTKLERVESMEVDEIPATRQRRSSINADNSSLDLLKLKPWKCGLTFLEFLQNKQKIIDPHLLIPSLFGILQKCLQFEDQSNVEYVKQLVLSCLHHLCAMLAPDGEIKNDLISEKIFKIEPVVQCIRGTQNPQTHHHALQLLSHSALMLPDQVLHNMMDIFTFMGSSVVRHDDAYSFQIITNIISSIIPTLTKLNETKKESQRNKLVIPVLKVFSDIILDVPEHRRLPLYTKLLDTLGVNEYLWMFIAVLIESYVTHPTKETEKSNDRRMLSLKIELPQRVEIGLALTKEFDCDTIIITSTKLLEFLRKFPACKPTNDSEKLSNDVLALFNANSVSKREYRHFKYEIIKFIATLTSSVEFVNKVAQLSDENAKSMKELYQHAIISLLTYIPIISKATEQTSEAVRSDYWQAMLHYCFNTLENVISLLAPNVLLIVIHGLLMKNKLASVRRRVIELLINELLQNEDIFKEENEKELVDLFGKFITALN